MGVKKDKLEGSGTHIKVKTPPTCTQPIQERWVLVKGFKGCGLAIWRKEVYSKVPAEASFGEMSCWDGISPKRDKHDQPTKA